MEKVAPKTTKLKKFFATIMFLLILAVIIYGLQYFYHIFDTPLKQFNQYLSAANGVFFQDMVWGVSIGTLVFVVILIIFPILMKNINTGSYFRNLFDGIISSFIFFVSQIIYGFFEKINKLYLLLSIIAVAIITTVLIQIAAKMYKNKADQVEFRTAYIASITAGLIFGVLLRLLTIAFNYTSAGLQNFHLKL